MTIVNISLQQASMEFWLAITGSKFVMLYDLSFPCVEIISRVMINPVFGVFDQVRHKTDYTNTEDR